MNILALETTGDVCSIAIRDPQGTLVERSFRHRMHLSERLIDDVDALLHDAGMELVEMDCLAVGVGPGSFTGVRLGVMTAKTWADTLAKPVIGINALDALAEENIRLWPGLTVAVIRARPGAIYAGAYPSEQTDSKALGEPAMMTIEELANWVSDLNMPRPLLVGDGVKRNREAVETEFRNLGLEPVFGPTESPRASVVAAIAERRYLTGQIDNALSLAPLYVSPPNIDPRVEARTAEALRTS